jgi:hypothetical protein
MMEFRRERMDIGWKLVPSMITVKPLDDMFWTIYRKRFNDHTGRPDRLDEWSRSSREARSVLVGPGPRQ